MQYGPANGTSPGGWETLYYKTFVCSGYLGNSVKTEVFKAGLTSVLFAFELRQKGVWLSV